MNDPKTFRKRPVEVEAMRLPEAYPHGVDPSSDDYARNIEAANVLCWLDKHLPRFDPLADDVPVSGWSIDPATGFVIIATLEGVMQAKPGDWVVRGTRGEFYPCKPGPFADTFEEVAP
ncbi:hypothetical protein GS491_23570 [Rhodococcus hoagii]|nr:hypothetical protein [Prescottella equi]NKS42261.1 hypothetical protein [Prescottella equi]NKS42529.1 hypothetical protein [Prescottella equi]